ncbi:hypothetical protein SRB5_26040 [Streptomyces sp. RB5]|uniref:Uncharacterized protein n=1 Tax=Streptomyces smaragdinus TaxID=2585196 RepID=A0A7K0CG60_9ACTN|nr:hypothetical protein [Streptomyces smaragdinus]MQY12470.1 hypothetical protein [Streptomyces smaragdinus]
MSELDEHSWAEAVGMYGPRRTVRVRDRENSHWVNDVPSLLRGRIYDNRGWKSIDFLGRDFEREKDPYYPFAEIPNTSEKTELFTARMTEIARPSARKFLVALATPWLNAPETPDFTEKRGEWENRADIILSRFPGNSRFYANTGSDSANIDYYQRVASWNGISHYDCDQGLFLVSTTEIGMIWSFRNL